MAISREETISAGALAVSHGGHRQQKGGRKAAQLITPRGEER
jgi:hypothetical protein